MPPAQRASLNRELAKAMNTGRYNIGGRVRAGVYRPQLLTSNRLDALSQEFGVARSDLNRRFLAKIPRESRILEVGCNEGNQLCALREIGFAQLYGIEVQEYALRRACNRLKTAQFVLATAFEIPFPDGFFDVIFTSGVLIHIAPPDLPKALHEIHRCAGGFIWGLEYYCRSRWKSPTGPTVAAFKRIMPVSSNLFDDLILSAWSRYH